MTEVVVVIGAGSIGQAIARRVSAGKHVLLADLRQENAERRGEGTERRRFRGEYRDRGRILARVGSRARGDKPPRSGRSPASSTPPVSLRHRLRRGPFSPSTFMARRWCSRSSATSSPAAAPALSSLRNPGTACRALTAEQDKALATTPADELLALPMLQPDEVKDPLHAYQISKRGNSLRVMAEAVRWGKRGARVNTISPGIIITPLANDELCGPRGDGYRRLIELSAAGRAGTPDEIGTVGALLMGPDGAFITGSDFLMDGGVTAAYWYGELAPV